MDIYQGKINTISPAIGNYDLQTFVNIDREPGVTGISGVTGTGTLQPVKWEQGVTGIQADRFTNLERGL